MIRLPTFTKVVKLNEAWKQKINEELYKNLSQKCTENCQAQLPDRNIVSHLFF